MMLWQILASSTKDLPAYCSPTSDFLHQLSSTFHVCIPTWLAFISTLLGSLSIISWLFAQLPQIYRNYTLSSTAGLSFYFLIEWCLGDLTNLLGTIFAEQATWQKIVAGYYCFVDVVLVGQWIYYARQNSGWTIKKTWIRNTDDNGKDNVPAYVEDAADGRSVSDTESIRSSIYAPSLAQDIRFPRPKHFSTNSHRSINTPNSLPSNSPNLASSTPRRTVIPISSSLGPTRALSPHKVLFVTCIIATLARASPSKDTIDSQSFRTPAISAGTGLAWTSTLLYLLSRLPQLWQNYTRKSTSGLSPLLFLAAFCGNLFYSSSLLTNPCAWDDYPPHGAGGWLGDRGSERKKWILRALPFWLGAAGVLVLDAVMGWQFYLYGEHGTNGNGSGSRRGTTVVFVEEVDQKRRRKRWKIMRNGWMRGWYPNFAIVKSAEIQTSRSRRGREREGLLDRHDDGAAYGTM